MFMSVLAHAWSTWRAEEGARSPGTGVIDRYKPPYMLGTKPAFLAKTSRVLNLKPSFEPLTSLLISESIYNFKIRLTDYLLLSFYSIL